VGSRPDLDADVYDTDRFTRLAEIAEDLLKGVAERYEKRILVQLIRSVPLSAVYAITADRNTARLIQAATTAALRFGRDSDPALFSSDSKMYFWMDPGFETSNRIASDIGRLLGAAFTWFIAEADHRYAGKGGKLQRPQPVPAYAWERFDHYPENGFLVVLAPEFEPDEALKCATDEYDRRREREGIMISSMPEKDDEHEELRYRDLWWSLAGDSDHNTVCVIRFPALNLSIQTSSYLIRPTSFAGVRKHLSAFPQRVRDLFGFDVETLADLCGAVGRLIWRETAFDLLTPGAEAPGRIELISAISKNNDSRLRLAPELYYSIFARAQIRNSVSEFIRALTPHLEADGRSAPEAAGLAESFIRRFTRIPSFERTFDPALFLPIDSNSIALDLAAMQDFFDMVLRQVLAGDGDIGHTRGSHFERVAREILIANLHLSKTEIPIQPNTKLRNGNRDFGDVDFAFVHDDVLVHLDMKSFPRSPADFRGDYFAIQKRIRKLTEELTAKVDPRGLELLRVLKPRYPRLRGVMNLLCVGVVEFIPWADPNLRYGEFPRVLTTDEVVELVSDQGRFASMAASADLAPST